MKFLLLTLFALLAPAAFATDDYLCPQIQMSLENDTCETLDDFNLAMEPLYKATMAWVEWFDSFEQAPPYGLMQMALYSQSSILEAKVSNDGQTSMVETSEGSYSVIRGKGHGNSRFLEAMEEQGQRNLGLDCGGYCPYNTYPRASTCCLFCGKCGKRRLETTDKAILSQAAKLEEELMEATHGFRKLENARSFTNACEWLQAQKKLPGCLRRATVRCEYLGED